MHVMIETAFLTPSGIGWLKFSFHFLAFSSSSEMGTGGGSG